MQGSQFRGWLDHRRRPELMVGPGLVRYLSAIVLMELPTGASTRAARRALDGIARAYGRAGRLLVPAIPVFEEAGTVLQALRARGREGRRASLVHDVLIALTARSIGATLFTANRGDFEAIRDIRSFELQVVQPA